jgi:DNA polymerase/3'-5' exonuclease PolX
MIYYQLLNVYGIGPSKARNLIENNGIKSIQDLRENKNLLTRAQKIGLDCYEDLLERIPRSEMFNHQQILLPNGIQGEIVGSFRRKAENSGDIDVMLLMSVEEFKLYIEYLKDIKYLRYVLASGDKKMLGICKLSGKKHKYRRLDLIRNTKEEYPYMKLYFTGSSKFNMAFRKYCLLNKGLSLNEHSFKPEVRGLFTEEDIFKHVGLNYVDPENRIDEKCLQ